MRDIVSSLDSEVNFGASEGWVGVFCKFHKQTTKDGDCRVMARLRLEAAEVAWGRSSPHALQRMQTGTTASNTATYILQTS